MILSDGTKAWLLIAEIEKIEGPRTRLAVYTKLVSATAAGRTLVVSSWVVGGQASGPFLQASGIRPLVEAYVRSLVLDAKRLDEDALRKATAALSPKLSAAIAATSAGNAAIDGDPRNAVAAFEKALEACNHLPAAQNGLAWVLLTANEPALIDVPRALDLAKQAVEGTGRLDAATLDTLALALFKSGAKEEAIATIKEAIALAPSDPDLQRALEKYESSGR